MSIGANKVTGRVGFINKTAYKEFKEKYPNENISLKEYTLILKESNYAIRDHILSNPLGFKLPYNFGYIAVDKFKVLDRYVAIDWVNTLKFGKVIPLTNLHSFGYLYKIKIYKNPKMQPMRIYKMNAHRIIKRMLAQNIFAGKEYLSIDRSYYSKRFNIGKHTKMSNTWER